MIYCVEDDSNIRDLVVYALKTGGFEAAGFSEAESFYKAVSLKKPSLVLLDLMLPGEDGLSILKQLKSNGTTKEIPVILLTAKGEEYDKVTGLDAGADDYITKPFGVMELLSRVKAVLRRTSFTGEKMQIAVGSLSLDKDMHKVFAEGREVALTFKEFELLNYLMENRRIVLTRDQILEAIWGYKYEGENRTVDVHIRNLRQKLGEAGNIIETVRGIGYRIGGTE